MADQPRLDDTAAKVVDPPAHLRGLPEAMRNEIQAASLAAHRADPPPQIDAETMARLRTLVRGTKGAPKVPYPRASGVLAVEPSNLDRA